MLEENQVLLTVSVLVWLPSVRCFSFEQELGNKRILVFFFSVFHLSNISAFFFRYFSLNESSGALTIRQNTPAGSYWLRVLVSDGVWPDVMSGVRVHVRELEEKAILSTASLRLTGNNAGTITDSSNGINTVRLESLHACGPAGG